MKCIRCETENAPGTRFCGNCGNQLTAPAPIQVKSSAGKWIAIAGIIGGIGLLGVCGLCFLLVLVSNPAPQNRSTINAPAGSSNSTNPNSSLTYEEISSTARQLTEIKRNDYYKSLVGKHVYWSGKVADVTNNGEIHVRIMNPFGYDVVLQGVPQTASTTLNLKDLLEFDGTITDVNDMFGSGSPIITLKSVSLTKQ